MSNVIAFPTQRAWVGVLPDPGVYACTTGVLAVVVKRERTVLAVDDTGRLFETVDLPVGTRLDGPMAKLFSTAADMLAGATKLAMSCGLTGNARKAANAQKYAAQLMCIEVAEFLQERS